MYYSRGHFWQTDKENMGKSHIMVMQISCIMMAETWLQLPNICIMIEISEQYGRVHRAGSDHVISPPVMQTTGQCVICNMPLSPSTTNPFISIILQHNLISIKTLKLLSSWTAHIKLGSKWLLNNNFIMKSAHQWLETIKLSKECIL